jgi:hypothetical protein
MIALYFTAYGISALHDRTTTRRNNALTTNLAGT